jgi:hypothetical protein
MPFSRTLTAALLVTSAISGCASQTSPSAEPVTTSSVAPSEPVASVPTGPPPGVNRPSGPPKTPTDIIHSPGWTEGYIVRGGSGPCYGLLDMDGFPYAMYSDTGTTLQKGDHVRVRVTPSKLRIDCGEGTAVRMEAVQHVS